MEGSAHTLPLGAARDRDRPLPGANGIDQFLKGAEWGRGHAGLRSLAQHRRRIGQLAIERVLPDGIADSDGVRRVQGPSLQVWIRIRLQRFSDSRADLVCRGVERVEGRHPHESFGGRIEDGGDEQVERLGGSRRVRRFEQSAQRSCSGHSDITPLANRLPGD